MAFYSKSTERRKSSLIFIKEALYLLVTFGLACHVAGRLDLELKPPNVNLDFPLPLLLQVQNPGKVILHFCTRLAVVIDCRFIGRRISEHKMRLFVNSVIESSTEIQLTDEVRAPMSQKDVTFL